MNSLVILPFRVTGEGPESRKNGEVEILELGLADALAGRLGSLPGVIVRPLASVREIRPALSDPAAIGRQLRAEGVVDAFVQIAGGKARATVRLLRSSDGRQLWFDTVESDARQVFALEDTIAQGIAQQLAPRLAPEDVAVRKVQPEVEDLYSRGRVFWMRRDLAGFERARDLFEQALRLDPSFAPAHAGLADCYLLLGLYNYQPVGAMLLRARAEANEALRLDAKLASAYATSALITQNLERDWKRTESEYRRSLALAPNSSQPHHWFAEFLSVQARFEESAREFAKAEELDPISSIIRTDEAQMWFFAGEATKAIAILRQVERLDPAFDVARDYLARIDMVRREDEEAWRVVQSMNSCDEACRRKWTAWLPARDPSAARQALHWLEGERLHGRIPPWTLAIAYTRQGNLGRALEVLEAMADKKETGTITMKVEPALDPLRAEPRFRKLLDRLGL